MPDMDSHSLNKPSGPTEMDGEGSESMITPAELAEAFFEYAVKFIPPGHIVEDQLGEWALAYRDESGRFELTGHGKYLLEEAARLYLDRTTRNLRPPLNTLYRILNHVEEHYPEHMSDTEKRRLLYAHIGDIISAGGAPLYAQHMVSDSLIRALWAATPPE